MKPKSMRRKSILIQEKFNILLFLAMILEIIEFKNCLMFFAIGISFALNDFVSWIIWFFLRLINWLVESKESIIVFSKNILLFGTFVENIEDIEALDILVDGGKVMKWGMGG